MHLLLPETVSALLRTSPTAAMAALLLISTSHRGLLDWFSRTAPGAMRRRLTPSRSHGLSQGRTLVFPGVGSRRGEQVQNGVHREPHGNGADPRLAKRDADDAALLEAMRVDPAGPLGA